MNSTLIDLGFFQIKWYSFFILIAISTSSFLIYKEGKKKNLNSEYLIDMLFYGIIIGIIGARLYYVLFNIDYYLNNPLETIMLWQGGLAIHGGLLSCLTFLFIYTKKTKKNILLILDIIVVNLLLAQSIGRWGNFFNQEAYGRVVTLKFLKSIHLPTFIIKGMYINNAYREPTFLYESILSLLGFFSMVILRKKIKIKTGQLTGIYLIWYGAERFLIESFRSDSLMLGSLKMAQIVSVIFNIVGIYLIIKCRNNILYKEEKIS